MAEEKHYPASEHKLRSLRAAGIVPFSSDVMCFAAIIGAAIGINLVFRILLRDLSKLAEDSWSKSPESVRSIVPLIHEAVYSAWHIMLALALPCLIFVFLLGGLQTKFLCSFSLLKFDFSRIFPRGRAILGTGSRGVRAVLDSLKVLSWFLAVLVVLGVAYQQYLEHAARSAPVKEVMGEGGIYDLRFSSLKSLSAAKNLSNRTQIVGRAVEPARKSLNLLAVSAVTFSFFMGALSWFLVSLRFRQSNRMSREELEAEYKETEAPAQMRNAREQLY